MKRRMSMKTATVMLAPFTLLFVVFTLVPILSSVVLSFSEFDMLNPPRFVGFDNYIRMLVDDPVFPIAVRNTLVFAFLTGPLGYILSFFFAWMINELRPKPRAWLTLLFYAPTLAGNVFFLWLFLFSGDAYGLVNSTLMRLGLVNDPVQWLTDTRYSLGVVVLVMLWLSMGAGFLAIIAGFQGISRELYEAAAVDGIRNRWQELWYVTLPQMAPQLLFAAVVSISTSFAVGYQSMELTGFPSTDYATHTLVLHILDFGAIRFEMGYASALAFVLFVAMALSWRAIGGLFRRIAAD